MKVFICWSGERSRIVAEGLRDWLPNVFQDLTPWISAEDLNKGVEWRSVLHDELDGSSFGVVCLTPENLDSKWLLFESGALSKAPLKGDVSVCTYLLDLDPSDVEDPLGQFNHTVATKEDTLKLLSTINSVRGESAFQPRRLEEIFEKWWPDLAKSLEEARQAASGNPPSQRDNRELLEDILETVRRLERNALPRVEHAAQGVMFPAMNKGVTTAKASGHRGLWDIDVVEEGETPGFATCDVCNTLRAKGHLMYEFDEENELYFICDDCRERGEKG